MALVTFPPNFAMGARGYHLGCQDAVQCRVPLPGHFRLQCCQIVKPGQNLPPGAVRTAAAAHGAGSYCGLVVMALLATPPHLPVGTRRDLLRRQCFIFARMPLGRNGRKLADQIIFTSNHLFSGAYGATAAAAGAGRYGGLPLMSLFTAPPHLTSGARRNGIRGDRPVFCWVPLDGKPGVLGSQIVFRRVYFPVGAHRTATANHAGFDLCPPLMAFFTNPPHHPVTAGEHLLRGEGAVFDGMPLAGQFWKERGQIVLSRLSHLTRADRAAGSAAGSGIYRRLPAVAFLTTPPDFSLATIGNLLRRQGKIACGVPLLQ